MSKQESDIIAYYRMRDRMKDNTSYTLTKEVIKNALIIQGYKITNEKNDYITFSDSEYSYTIKLTQEKINEKAPYINGRYNPNYGDNRICECGHPYIKHFDTYDNMEAVGCKYCGCYHFIESKYKIGDKIEFTQEGMTPLLHGKIIEINRAFITVKCKNGCRRYVSNDKIIRIM